MASRDFITVLTTRDAERPTKVWSSWDIKPKTGTPYRFKASHVGIDSIDDLYRVINTAAAHDSNVVVRGRAKFDGFEQRLAANFEDVPHHWMMIDVDGFRPVLVDPDDSEQASLEYIATHLPAPFHDRSFVWHCSSSSGVPSSAGKLKMHIFFWLESAMDSASLTAWADKFEKGVMDRSVYNIVQQHFIANPRFENGLADPIAARGALRTGLWRGHGDEVDLVLDGEQAVAATRRRESRSGAGVSGGSGAGGNGVVRVNPAEKEGLIGKFHRLITVDDVIDTILPGQFERVPGDDRRLTWTGSQSGAREGAWITDDRMHIGATHDSWPFGPHRAPNLWDIVQEFKFGALDAGVDDLIRAMGPQALPSYDAMIKWAARMIEQREGVEEITGNKAVSGEGGGGGSGAAVTCFGGITQRIMAKIAHELGVDKKDIAALEVDINFNAAGVCHFIESSYWHPKSGMFTVLHAGQEKYFGRSDIASIARDFVKGGLINVAEVGRRAQERAEAAGLNQTSVARAVKSARGILLAEISEYIMVYRQATEVAVEVDMFDRRSRIVVSDGKATIVYAHRPMLVVDEPDMKYVDDFRVHFPQFDDFLKLTSAARFASSRKNAYLWLNAPSNFGKSLLMDLLKRGGLVVETSVTDIERMISGSPSGKTLASFRHAWILAIDEFKTVRSELKQLTESITFAPKNMPACTVELYLKLFLSAEHVEAMGSAHTGIEEQFTNRFSIISASGSIDARPLFTASKYTYKQHLYSYIAGVLNGEVARYVAMGRKAASDAAEEYIKKFHAEHKFGNGVETMDQKVPDLADQFVEWVRGIGCEVVAKNGSRNLSLIERDVGDCIVVASDDRLYLKKSYKLIEMWIEGEFSKSEGGAVRHKRKAIHDHLGEITQIKGSPLTSHSGLKQNNKAMQLRGLSLAVLSADFD